MTAQRAGFVIAASACACATSVVSTAPASATTVPASSAIQAVPAKSTMRCYATRGDPGAVICYRFSKKAEFRHGSVVYVPILIQVPTPSNPTSVIIVNSLNDIHPSDGSK
ncbi:hypothetical protein GT039_19230 [Streptomyces sp. SID2955]|nr:hypothetical protein [Streptomyces sp. SID2955]